MNNNIIINKEGYYDCQVTRLLLDNTSHTDSGRIDVSIVASNRSDGKTEYIAVISSTEVLSYIYVVDKYTGIEFKEFSPDALEEVTLSDSSITLADGTVVKFNIMWNNAVIDNGDGTATDYRYLWVIVPSEYDGLLFKVNSDAPLYFAK